MLKSMFKMPKAPKPQELPKEQPTPTIDQAAQRAEDEMRMRRRKGRNQYMLTKSQSVGAPNVGQKTLTGS
jgi:hypothetical protein